MVFVFDCFSLNTKTRSSVVDDDVDACGLLSLSTRAFPRIWVAREINLARLAWQLARLSALLKIGFSWNTLTNDRNECISNPMMSDTKPWYRFFGSQARHQVYPVVDELLGRSFLVAVYPEILSGLPLRDQSRTHTPTLPSSSVTWKRTRIGFCCFHQHFFLSTTPFANVQRK